MSLASPVTGSHGHSLPVDKGYSIGHCHLWSHLFSLWKLLCLSIRKKGREEEDALGLNRSVSFPNTWELTPKYFMI